MRCPQIRTEKRVCDSEKPHIIISDGGSKSLCRVSRDDTCFLGFWGFSPPPETLTKHAQNKKLIA